MRILIVLMVFLLSLGCSTPVKTPPEVEGKIFPQVQGKRLTGEGVRIPDQFLGKETVYLIGYQQRAQFDIDRWILGILQADIPVQIVELPTIGGMMPRAVQGFIDDGMRSGIPKEDWASVITIYEDAAKIIAALGNERPQSAFAVLVAADGKISWLSNRGYSAQQVLELKKLVATSLH